MKYLLFPLFLWTAFFAKADYVIEQKVGGEGEFLTVVIKFKGDRIRMDTPQIHGGDASVIIDLKSGEAVTLFHSFKAMEKTTVAAMKKDAIAEAKVSGKAGNSGKGKVPKTTGKNEKVGEWDAEIFELTLGKEKLRLWVVKDFPNYKAILEQWNKLAEATGGGGGFDPHRLDLGGFVVKVERSSVAKGKAPTLTSTIVKAKEEAVDDSVFKIPADYESAENPDLVIQQDLVIPKNKGKLVIRLKNNLARADLPTNNSLLLHLDNDDVVLLKHAEKAAVLASFGVFTTKVAPEQKAALDLSKFPKPAASGKTEKVAEWDAEIFESALGESKFRAWVVKSFPQSKPLQKRIRKITSMAADGVDPYQFDLGGLIVKWESVSAGETRSASISKIIEEPFADSEMETPAKYTKTEVAGEFAKGEYIIEIKQAGSDNGDEITRVKIKGDMVRMDSAGVEFSYILDRKTEDFITLDHAEKTWSKEKLSDNSEVMSLMRGFDRSKLVKPTTTGKKQKVGKSDAEIFEGKLKKGKVRLWVVKDYPDYNAIREKLAAVNGEISDEYDPFQFDLGGMVLKAEAPGSTEDKVTTTFTKISEEAVDASVFKLPNDYKEEKNDE